MYLETLIQQHPLKLFYSASLISTSTHVLAVASQGQEPPGGFGVDAESTCTYPHRS